MWQAYNPNPAGRSVGDCAVRAIAKALDIDWETAFIKLAVAAFNISDMPSSNSVIGAVLRKNRFHRENIPNECPACYTVEDFSVDHPRGIYVLGFDRHVATMIDGVLYDSWDSSKEIPQYFWYRKDEER